MILIKTNIPPELVWAISSGWETDSFSTALTLKPGTGAELWLSTKPFYVSNSGISTYSNMQLLAPRESAYVIRPNYEKIVVLRIRHNRLYMLSREQTHAIIDTPVDLHALLGGRLMNYLPRYFELGKEVVRGLSVLLGNLLNDKRDLKNDLIDFLYQKPTTRVSCVAEQFQYTQRHIQKKFLEAHGITIKKYQLICRIERAIKETIQLNDVHAAIFNNGFHDQPHFIKSFRAIHTVTPTEFITDQVNHYFYNRESPAYLKLP